jgi:hypothetical protein
MADLYRKESLMIAVYLLISPRDDNGSSRAKSSGIKCWSESYDSRRKLISYRAGIEIIPLLL